MNLLTHTKSPFILGGILTFSIVLTGCGGGGGGGSKSSAASSKAASSVAVSSTPASVAASSSPASLPTSSTPSSLSSSSVEAPVNSSSSVAVSSSTAGISSSISSVAITQTGLFIDSAVAGIHYETTPGGFSGKTASDGAYSYATGDSVVFSIGALKFPAVMARDVVTPLDIANTNDPENNIALNIAALLQSLDIDGNPDNGISIDYDKAAANAQTLNFDQTYETFAALPAVISLVENSGSTNTALISKSSALTHLQTSLVKVNSAPLIGTWYVNESSGLRYVLFLLDSHNYAALTYEGGATFERGTYQWNKTTGTLTIDTIEVAGSTRKTIPFTSNNLLAIDRDTLTIKGSHGTTTLAKLHSATNPQIGGWSAGTEDNLSVFAFIEDYYFHGQNGKDVLDDAGNLTGTAGAEYGTYTNGASGFVVTTQADSNKQWGFSHPCAIVETHPHDAPANDYSCTGGSKETLTVNDNVLDYYSAANVLANQTNPPDRNNEPEHYYFNRVIKNDFDVFGLPHPLVGSWTQDDGTSKDLFIFSDYKTFTHIKVSNDDPNCKVGIVNAAYTWNQKTFQFKLNVSGDTTNGCAADGANTTLTPKGNTLELAESGNKYIFTKTTNSTDLIGTWTLKTATSYTILVFTDTAYFLSDYDSSGTDNAPLYGTERGTYTYSSGSAYFTVIEDGNGTRGFSDGSNSTTPWPVGLSSNGDSFTIGDGFVMKRLK